MTDTQGMHLLERDASSRSLAEYASEARRGEGRLVLLAGEAGVGKSALVERLQRDLPDARWSWGACDGLFTPRPLAPLFDLADQMGGTLLDLCRSGADREQLFRALLHQVSEPEVLDVTVVEDVHWADEATLDLLRFVGRRLRDASVMLIVTYRDDALAAGDSLSIALGDLAMQRSTRRIELAPLSADAVGGMAEGTGLEASELFRLTGGNPFYLTEVLQTGTGTVPTSARDVALARAAGLRGGSRGVLDVAALIGARVELRLLASITECRASTVDELLACGLLIEDGKWLRFRHEIARLAVEEAIASHRRTVIHRRILDGLGACGCDDDARMAFHAEAAGDGPAVLRHAPPAARQAAELAAHREAAAQFQRALRFAGEADSATVAGLYDRLADELSLVDRWQEAADACERALELWREAGDRLREGDTLQRLTRTMWNLCRGEEAITAIQAAISVLRPLGPTYELAWAYARFATYRMLHLEDDEAVELTLRAQAIAERLGAPDVLSDALNTQAVCAGRKDRDWTGQMDRALRIALSERHHEQAGRAYANFCALYVEKRLFVEAERYLAEGIAYCDEHDMPTYATFLRSERANALDHMGRWDEAAALSREVLDAAGRSPANRICSLRRLGGIRARRNEPGAWEYLDEAAVAADADGQSGDAVFVRLARAEAYWLEGKHNEAIREAELADDMCAGDDPWTGGVISVWLARTGSSRSPRGDVAEPYRLELDGDWARAAQAWGGLGCPYDAAMAMAGAQEEAALRQALVSFADLGVSPAIQIVRRKLRLLGARSIPAGPRSATRAHPFRLTLREREVLGLLCAKYTNAEIAAKLFISAKTVESHVSAILAKLGAPTRNAAADQAVRLGIVTAND